MTDFLIRPGNSGVQSSGAMAVVTPSDSTDLTYTTRGVLVGGAGNLEVVPAVLLAGQTSVIIPSVAAGTFLPISVNRIRAASTTATTIVAFF
jgi:hypothetical protein